MMKNVILVIFMLMGILNFNGYSQEKSIYELSDKIEKVEDFITNRNEKITLIEEKIENISSNKTIHYRTFFYEEKGNEKDSYNFNRIIIKKGKETIYTYEHGLGAVNYKINTISNSKQLVLLSGGWDHEHEVLVLVIENESIKKIAGFEGDFVDIKDIDLDGIDEIVAFSSGYLIPKGGLADSAVMVIIYQYNNEKYVFSPQLVKNYYKNRMDSGKNKCNFKEKNSVSVCTNIMTNLMVDVSFKEYDKARNTINNHMVFVDRNSKNEFIKEFSEWCFLGNEISLILKKNGINSEIDLMQKLKK